MKKAVKQENARDIRRTLEKRVRAGTCVVVKSQMMKNKARLRYTNLEATQHGRGSSSFWKSGRKFSESGNDIITRIF